MRKAKGCRSSGDQILDVSPEEFEAIRQIFFGEGREPLTADLIDQLVAKGWDREVLLKCQREGAVYCRPRDSIVWPPVVG